MKWEPSRRSSCPLPTWEVSREQKPQIHLSKVGTWKSTCQLENYFPKEDASKTEKQKNKKGKSRLWFPLLAPLEMTGLFPRPPLSHSSIGSNT